MNKLIYILIISFFLSGCSLKDKSILWKNKEPETPISTKNFLNFVQSRANDFGRLIGVEHGEGFISNRKLGFTSFDELI